jgi:hypothetical protein
MSTTLNELVRDQILAEGPQTPLLAATRYVDRELNAMTNVELLERISDAIELMHRDDFESLSVRLGI